MQNTSKEAIARLAQVNEIHRLLDSLAKRTDYTTQKEIQKIVDAGLDAYFATKAGL